jgi:uncharacterized membrane protein
MNTFVKKQLIVINAKESVIVSLIKDISQLALLFYGFYLNYKYMGGSVMMQIVLTILFFFLIVKLGASRKNVFTDRQSAIEHINKFYDGEEQK